MDEKEGIPEFYSGKNIFITGGFGFLGKVLIEKLLRSCPDVSKLYILIRSKRGKSIQERMDKINSGLLFNKIKETRPEIITEKLVLLEGDITQKKMGLSRGDYEELIQNVHVVLHLAASIKFDDPLAFALKVNVIGTKRVLEFATEVNNLYSFVHISTAYAHYNFPEVKEMYYKPDIKWDKMVDIMEKTDNAAFEILSAKVIDEYPNTYVFTKGLAEDLIWDYKKILPIAILRPSIVVSCYDEPIPGWIDNLYGPAGFIFGAAKGVIRVMYSDADAYAGYIPADISTRATIAAAWFRHQYRDLNEEDHIYNINYEQSKTNRTIMLDCYAYLKEYPLRYPLWSINVHMTKSFFVFMFLFYLTHLAPAILIDTLLIIARQKPILCNIQKKYFKGMNLMSCFILRKWDFHIDNFKRLDRLVPDKDKKDFAPNLQTLDLEKFMREGFDFGRIHVLKDAPGKKYQFWLRNKVLEVLDIILSTSVVVGAGWILLRLFNVY